MTENLINETLNTIEYDGLKLPTFNMEILYTAVRLVVIIAILLLSIYIYLNFYYFQKVERLLFVDQLFRRERSNSIYVLLHQAQEEYIEKTKYQANIKGDKTAKGVVLGKTKNSKYVCIPEKNEFHLIVSGASGSGKTTNIVVPTLRAWNCSALYYDISGDILVNVAKYKKKKTYVYTPYISEFSRDKYKFCKKYIKPCLYDPLYRLHTFKSCYCAEFIDEVEKIASYLIPVDEKLSDIEIYYRSQAQAILCASIVHFYKLEITSFPNICSAILINDISELITELKADTTDYVRLTMTSFEDNFSPQTLSGIKNSLASFIDIFAKRELVARSLRRPRRLKNGNYEPSLSPELLDKEGCNICIYIPESELRTLQPLLRLLTMQIFQYAFSKLSDANVLLCLDELARLGKLPDFEDALRTLRKRKVKIMGALQSLTDLSIIYGNKEAEGILNNFNFKVCLAANDTDTQEYFAKLVGKRTHAKTSYSHGETTENFGDLEREDYILEPSSLQYLPKKNKLLALTPEGWMLLTRNPYYAEKPKKRRKK